MEPQFTIQIIDLPDGEKGGVKVITTTLDGGVNVEIREIGPYRATFYSSPDVFLGAQFETDEKIYLHGLRQHHEALQDVNLRFQERFLAIYDQIFLKQIRKLENVIQGFPDIPGDHSFLEHLENPQTIIRTARGPREAHGLSIDLIKSHPEGNTYNIVTSSIFKNPGLPAEFVSERKEISYRHKDWVWKVDRDLYQRHVLPTESARYVLSHLTAEALLKWGIAHAFPTGRIGSK